MGHSFRAAREVRKNAAPRRIGQSSKRAVQSLWRIFNHLVNYLAGSSRPCKYFFQSFLRPSNDNCIDGATQRLRNCIVLATTLTFSIMKTPKDNIQLSAVEDHDGILTIRGGGARRDWNGIHYKQGMSAKNVGTTKLSANIATIPPGGVAYAHIHVGFEVILYILEGKVRHEFGDGCRKVLENEAGDFIYIKPGVPHEVFNMSDTEPVVAFVARSSASEWDDIIPYDRTQKTD